MKCPFCQSELLKVTDSRDAVEENAIRRRRECQECERRFTTFETVELTIQVKKRDGTYEDFSQQKLIHGLELACKHTKISHEQVVALAAKITQEIMQMQKREITTRRLGDIVMNHLRSLDPVAYIRFACVYKRLTDIREVLKAIESTQMPEYDEETTHAFEKN